MDKDSKGQRKGEMTLCGNRERYGQGQQRTETVGDMTLWGNRERYGQGQQRTETVRGLWRRDTSSSGRTQPRIE